MYIINYPTKIIHAKRSCESQSSHQQLPQLLLYWHSTMVAYWCFVSLLIPEAKSQLEGLRAHCLQCLCAPF